LVKTRTLVTTADEKTWPKDKLEPILFLGEWCRRYSRKEEWQQLDVVVAPYHWDDRQKLYSDYQYLQELYEKLLGELSVKLNKIHSVEHSLRYWRILIGPWLGYFIQALFDRWFMLKHTIEQSGINICCVLERDTFSIVPNDMAHFVKLFVEDDWNEAIYGQLLEICWSETVTLEKIQYPHRRQKKEAKKLNIKYVAEWIIVKFNNLLPNENGHFFMYPYLPWITNFRLQLRLGQFPKLWRAQPIPEENIDCKIRESLFSQDVESTFVQVARKMISLHIPIVYLEGYEKLLSAAHQLPWPKYPTTIFTSISYSNDDLFKIWSADKVEKGVPLVIGQHGGLFGMTLFSFHEEHQIKIADKWLSWGWTDVERPQIIPIGNIKEDAKRTLKYNPKGLALIVETTVPRYSYHLYAGAIAGQWLRYFDDQCNFIDTLPIELQLQVLVRIYPRDALGWDQKERWLNKYPDIEIELCRKSIPKLIKNCRLIISTYNGTSSLEPLFWNVPTIMFWNPLHWEMNEDAKIYFDLLKSVGIYHDNPDKAAQHMIKVWGDVDLWWNSKEVQDARKKFCHRFTRDCDDLIGDLQSFFYNI